MTSRWLYAWALGSLALGAASLLVPLYVVALGGGAAALGVLAGTAAVLGTPGAVLWGRVADRTTDPRRVVAGSLAGSAAALAALPALDSVAGVIAAHAALWFVAAAAGPVTTLLVVADAPEDEWSRRIASLTRYQGYGWAGGLVLGTVWLAAAERLAVPALATQRWLLVVCAACAAVAGAAAARWLPASSAEVRDAEGRRVARFLARTHRNVRGATFVFAPNRLYWTTRTFRLGRLRRRFTPELGAYFLAVALFSTGFSAFWAPLPAYLAADGYAGHGTFALYLATSLVAAFCYGSVGGLTDRFDLRLLQAGALAVRAGAFPGVVLAVAATGAVGLATTTGLFALLGVTWAVIAVTGTALVTRLAPASARGEALGVHAALVTAAGGVGGLAGGWAATYGYGVAFGGAGALVAVGAGMVALLSRLSAPSGGVDAALESSMD